MKIDEKMIYKIANLAKINIEESEIPKLQKDLSQTLTWVQQLEEIKTDNISSESTVHIKTMPQAKDNITDGNISKQILHNAPKQHLNMFSVPRVVE